MGSKIHTASTSVRHRKSISTGAGKSKGEREQRGLSWNTLVLIAAAVAVIAYATYTEFFAKPRGLHKLPPIKGITADNWGTYRSHTYFGLRTKDPRSPLFGIMWYEQPDVMQRPHIRHWCDQSLKARLSILILIFMILDDNLPRYGWVAADGRTFGRQNLTDKAASIRFEWINYEDTWTAKMSIDGLKGRRFSVVVYLVAQDAETKFYAGHHLYDIISGRGPLLGDVRLAISSPQEKEILHSTLTWDDEFRLNQLSDLVLMNTGALESERGLVYQLSQQKPFDEGRFVAVQLNTQTNTEIEISFATRRHVAKTGTKFNIELNKRVEEFKKKFEDTFQLTKMKYTPVQMDMAKVALSNMLGSLGFWYGYNKVCLNLMRYNVRDLKIIFDSRLYFYLFILFFRGCLLMVLLESIMRITMLVVLYKFSINLYILTLLDIVHFFKKFRRKIFFSLKRFVYTLFSSIRLYNFSICIHIYILFRFSLWNTMMGTSLLAMPWALQQAGLIWGLILMMSLAFLSVYTAYLVVTSPKGLIYCPVELTTPNEVWKNGIESNSSSNAFWDFDRLWQLQFPALTGTLTLSYFIHNAVLTILRNQKHPENNARDLCIGYFLAASCYVFIGFTFYAGFPVQRSCISDNFLNNFGAGDILSSTARMFLLFQMVTVLPLLMFLIRSQLFYAIFRRTWPGVGWVILLNIIVVLIAALFAVFYPKVGSILRYVGSLSGLIYVFALPCLVYMRKLKLEGQLTPTKKLIHTTIIVLGLLNLGAQFLI
uniref:Mannosyl-oligosaccharide glucosidase n=1 Tax=Heterorhabditis bacteriophora TaxID=37862 RepID=A0A1I7XDH0_HETBA